MQKQSVLQNTIHNPIFWLSITGMGLAIFNMTTHWNLVCGIQSIGHYLGANC